jgi:hypothetical protein
LGASREKKLAMLERILAKYRPNGERAKVNPNFKNQKSKFQSFMDFHKLNFCTHLVVELVEVLSQYCVFLRMKFAGLPHDCHSEWSEFQMKPY